MLGVIIISVAVGLWLTCGGRALVRYYDLVGWSRCAPFLDCLAAAIAGPAMWLIVGSVRRTQEEEDRLIAQIQEQTKEVKCEQDR